jgi:hypothetical protein
VTGALLVVTAAKKIAVSVAEPSLGDVSVRLFFGHFVAAGGRLLPDALESWDGIGRGTQKVNQPVLSGTRDSSARHVPAYARLHARLRAEVREKVRVAALVA